MSSWGAATYGDPCRRCGYAWDLDPDDAAALVAAAPERFREALGDDDGTARHPDLAWSAAAYVCHVGDNLRIWAERLAGASLGTARDVTTYDADLLAEARRYDDVPLAGALWSLGRAAGDWRDAVTAATTAGVTLNHPDRGPQTVADVVRTNAHDVVHHAWDVARSTGQA
jgi:hypothetical protein